MKRTERCALSVFSMILGILIAACDKSHDGRPELGRRDAQSDAGFRSGAMTATSASDDCDGQLSQANSSGCRPSTASVDAVPADGGAQTTEPSAAELVWRQAEPLFSNAAINHVTLTLSDDQEQALRAEPGVYVRGGMRVRLADDSVLSLDDVGVRLKGQWGSARDLDQKAAFLIKTNEFVAGQKVLGLSKLAFNNMVQDPSMIREQLAYLLFRQMGIAAPRTGYATVAFNDAPYGLYATVEVVDNESFLDYWYGYDTGNLYEGAYGSDLEDGRVSSFDRDRGSDVAFADLYTLKEALDAIPEGSSFMTTITQIDTAWFARFTATELMLAHWDGYAITRNNYFLYPDLAGTWTFLPWGLDQTFGDSKHTIWLGDARVHQMCINARDCRKAMTAAYVRLSALFDELDLLGRIDALEALIRDAADADPRKEYGSDAIWSAIDAVRTFVRERPGHVARELACAEPAAVDADGDGASGCGEDCNDDDSAVFPDAKEVCNGVDDNCNGEVDENEECPSCVDVSAANGRYAVCLRRRTFGAAQADCQAQGGQLLSIGREQQQLELSELASDLGLKGEFWIGFTDEANEGEFEWGDGSAVTFTNWGDGEPNDSNGNEDCTEVTETGSWNDLACDAERAYVCWLE